MRNETQQRERERERERERHPFRHRARCQTHAKYSSVANSSSPVRAGGLALQGFSPLPFSDKMTKFLPARFISLFRPTLALTQRSKSHILPFTNGLILICGQDRNSRTKAKATQVFLHESFFASPIDFSKSNFSERN
jgi:hypothetical protein